MRKIIWLVVLVLIVVGVVAAVWTGGLWSRAYSAVYLQSGDLYFGKLVRFPTFGLKGVVSIQPTQNADTPLVATRFTNLFWGPEDFMQISRDKVLWIVKLKDEGQLAKVLKTNPDLISNNPTVPQPQKNEVVLPKPAEESAPKE